MITDICSMYILLAAATSFEIQPTIHLLGTIPGTEVLLTGIGSIPTTWSLMRQIGRRRPDLIIQAGIAGSFIPGQIGNVLAVKEELLGDVGVWEGEAFKTLFDMNFMDSREFPFSNSLLVNPYNRLLGQSGLTTVSSVTVNEITTDKARIGWYQQNWAPFVESMEGGAFHYTCLQEEIPFLQIRAVSNNVGERDKSKWDIRSAITNLNRQLTVLLTEFRRLDRTILQKDAGIDR